MDRSLERQLWRAAESEEQGALILADYLDDHGRSEEAAWLRDQQGEKGYSDQSDTYRWSCNTSSGDGYTTGFGDGYSYGDGDGYGNGYGDGYAYGYGDGDGYGNGYGDGYAYGDG